jgi:superfamily II DNA or RNA helicase
MCARAAIDRPQNLPPLDLPPLEGADVRARGWPWRVQRAWGAVGCQVIELDRLHRDAPHLGALLDPFDRVEALPAGTRWRRQSRGALSQHIARLTGAWPDQPLAALSSMRVPLWAHQRVPALAIVDAAVTRLVIADEVGLGKTLSAALVLAELSARGLCQRALVLTPAGLRDQWREELETRAGVHAAVVDGAGLVERMRHRPPGESPWTAPGIAIVSTDLARQPSVLAGLAAWPWDVLVVDEAHQVSSDSARAAAAARVASCSRIMLLLTATPHSGDPQAFRRLLTLGGAGAAAAWLRRERHEIDAKIPRRRTRRWRVRSTHAELRLLEALAAYCRRVDRSGGADARLAMVVLRKRALSSAEALVRSLEHRRAALAGVPGSQLALPLDGTPGEHDADDAEQPAALRAPGLEDRGGELAMLDALTTLAHVASRRASKWRAVERLIRGTSEPIICFTEFRDTLRALVERLGHQTSIAVLHGGLDRAERRDAVARFTHGDVRVLVATDAAAEGLNLQARCRVLVNIELPWSPLVLEQRAGRIDRIGQRRPVRVWELCGRSGHEAVVVAALARRAAAIATDLSGYGYAEENRATGLTAPVPVATLEGGAPPASVAAWWNLRNACATTSDARDGGRRRSPIWMRARHPAVGRGIVLIFTASPGPLGTAVEHVAVHVSMTTLPAGSPAAWLPLVTHAARPVAAAALRSRASLAQSLAAREAELLEFARATHDEATRRWQPSFFDRRANRIVEAARVDLARLTDEHERRRQELARPTGPARLDPVFALLVP